MDEKKGFNCKPGKSFIRSYVGLQGLRLRGHLAAGAAQAAGLRATDDSRAAFQGLPVIVLKIVFGNVVVDEIPGQDLVQVPFPEHVEIRVDRNGLSAWAQLPAAACTRDRM